MQETWDWLPICEKPFKILMLSDRLRYWGTINIKFACTNRVSAGLFNCAHRRRMVCIGVGAGKFLGCERFFPEFRQNCPKNFWATFYAIFMWFCMPFLSNQSKLAAIFARIFMEFAQIFKNFLKVLQMLPRFPLILPGFSGILPRFPSNQNIWACACTPCNPASYITVATWLVEIVSWSGIARGMLCDSDSGVWNICSL